MKSFLFHDWIVKKDLVLFAQKGNETIYSASFDDLLFMIEMRENIDLFN